MLLLGQTWKTGENHWIRSEVAYCNGWYEIRVVSLSEGLIPSTRSRLTDNPNKVLSELFDMLDD